MARIDSSHFISSFENESDPRRKRILDQAIRTFAELGYRGTDVQVIADRVGIGKGTIYRNYATKEGLFWATVAEVDARLRSYIHQALQEPPTTLDEFLRTVAISYAEFYEKNPDCLEINVAARSEFRGSIPKSHQTLYKEEIALICAWLEEGMARGELKTIDSQSISFAFAALMDGVTTIYCYSDVLGWKQSMVEQMRLAVELFLNGLRAIRDMRSADTAET